MASFEILRVQYVIMWSLKQQSKTPLCDTFIWFKIRIRSMVVAEESVILVCSLIICVRLNISQKYFNFRNNGHLFLVEMSVLKSPKIFDSEQLIDEFSRKMDSISS